MLNIKANVKLNENDLILWIPRQLLDGDPVEGGLKWGRGRLASFAWDQGNQIYRILSFKHFDQFA